MAGFIYSIFRKYSDPLSPGGYIGFDSNKSGIPFKRIQDHLKKAYGLEPGVSGGSILFKQYSACDVGIHIYANVSNCFGASIEAYNEFRKTWTDCSVKDEDEAKLAFAEIAWICSGADLANTNISIGDRGNFTYDATHYIEPLITKIYNSEELSLMKESEKDLKNLNKVVMHFPDNKENIEKLFYPEFYAIIRAFAFCASKIIFKSKKWEKEINEIYATCAIRGVNDCTNEIEKYVNKTLEQQKQLWNKNLPPHYQLTNANVEFDLTQDIKRISKFINDRFFNAAFKVTQQVLDIYGLGAISKARYYNPKTKQVEITDKELSSYDDTLRIKRNAYMTNIKLNKQIPKWYTLASTAIERNKNNPTYTQSSSEVIEILKKVSFEAFCNIVNQEKTPNLSFYSQEEFNALGIDTLYEKVKKAYNDLQIQGGIINFWELFYRDAITLYLKDAPLMISDEDYSEDDSVVFNSYDMQRIYSFTSKGAERILTAQSQIDSYEDLKFF